MMSIPADTPVIIGVDPGSSEGSWMGFAIVRGPHLLKVLYVGNERIYPIDQASIETDVWARGWSYSKARRKLRQAKSARFKREHAASQRGSCV